MADQVLSESTQALCHYCAHNSENSNSLDKSIMLGKMKEKRRIASSKLDGLSCSGDGYTFGRSEGPDWRQIILENIFYVVLKSQYLLDGT